MLKSKIIIQLTKALLFAPVIIIAGLVGAVIGLLQGVADWFRKPTVPKNMIPIEYEIPDRFKDLIPLTERLGIGDDLKRTESEMKLTDIEKQEINNTLKGRTKDLQEWIDSTNSAEVAVPFINLLEALAEMGVWPDKDDKST